MRRTVALITAPLAALLLLTACAGRTRKADELAKKGDWESALQEYRRMSAAHPADRDLLDKVTHAEHELAKTWVKRGLESQVQGKLGDAGEWWRKALELKPDETGAESARGIVTANAQRLEQFGDQAVQQKKYEDAFHAWGPLLILYPERLDLSNKATDAHKQFALELDGAAASLASKNLPGAALVTELRALQHDPMQTAAFTRATDLRKSILSKSAVSIPSVTMNDQGWWNFGVALVPRLERHLGEYPPYGPTKNASAIPATFVVTIEDFSWSDSTQHSLEAHEAKPSGASKEKAPNPKRIAQQKLVDDLDREVKYMEAGATMQGDRKSPWITAGPAATPTPAPAPAAGKKGATAAAAAAPSRKPMTARAATAEDIAKKKDELAAAKKDLDAMPEQVSAAEAASTWYSAVAETTRTVRAKVRFDVREPDFEQPVTKELELTMEAKDRSSDADAAHGVAADPLKLPPVEQMLGELADKFVEDGVAVMKDARQRRAERWLELAHSRHAQGQEDDSLDAFVWAMFILGAEDVPADARSIIASRLDGQDPKMVVTGP